MTEKRILSEAQWIEIVKAAPDAAFYGELQAILSSVRLSADLPRLLDETYLEPTRRAGSATAEQCASAWYNLGIAAATLPQAAPEAAVFAIECSRLVSDLAPVSVDLALRNRYLPVQALLILTASEETTSPRLCHRLLVENLGYLEALRERREQIGFDNLDEHLASALSITVRSLEHLVNERRALGALSADVSRVAAAALALAAQIEPERLRAISPRVMTGLDPISYLRLAAARAELDLGTDPVPGWEDHARRALGYLDALHDRLSALPIPLAWQVQLMRALALWRLGRPDEALAGLPALPDEAPQEVRDLRRHYEGLCRLALGDLDRARAALAETAPSAAEALESWKAKWLGASPEGQPVTDLTSDPLSDSQTSWRELAAIAFRQGEIGELLEWTGRSFGFLVDSLSRDRARWVHETRSRLRGPQVVLRAWDSPRSEKGWSGEIHADLAAAPGLAPAVPTPSDEVAVEDSAACEPLAQTEELLRAVSSASALILVLIEEHGILTAVARHREGRVTVSTPRALPAPTELFHRLERWHRHYLKRVRFGADAPEADDEGASLFGAVLEVAEGLWAPLLEDLLDEGYSDLVFVVDDLISDLPFHALRLDRSGQRLIDRARVTYAPSVYTAWRCSRRTGRPAAKRRGLTLRSLVDPTLDSSREEPAELAAALGADRHDVDPRSPGFWSELAEAEVLHVIAHGQHNVLLPLNTLWMVGWVDLGITKLIAGLDLPRCEVASNLVCEAAFPAVRRAPGIDLASVFLAAGARSVLASTWVVEDDLASEFCLAFFTPWSRGESASRCYQSALNQLRREHPSRPDFSWAGFRLVGGV